MDPVIAEYSFHVFLPIIAIFSAVILLTALHQWYYGFKMQNALRIFLATFFLIFAVFKLINLEAFAQAYAVYDIIAKRVYWYGYVYPFIELGLGIAYLCNWRLKWINIFTICLMLICATGVFLQLNAGSEIMCACLGAVFKMPMTYVTLFEDLVTAALAAVLLIL